MFLVLVGVILFVVVIGVWILIAGRLIDRISKPTKFNYMIAVMMGLVFSVLIVGLTLYTLLYFALRVQIAN